MVLFYSSVSVSNDRVTVNQHVERQDPETEAATWITAFLNLITVYVLFSLCHVQMLSVKTPTVFSVSAYISQNPTY